MILGITGTRRGWTPAQEASVRSVVACLPDLLLHGGAEGFDTQFHEFVRRAGMFSEHVEVYPTSRTWDYWTHRRAVGLVVHEVGEPLVRNRIIVDRCDHLLACPDGPERIRSGTWSTVRYARNVNKPITVVMPDGTVIEEKMVAVGHISELES